MRRWSQVAGLADGLVRDAGVVARWHHPVVAHQVLISAASGHSERRRSDCGTPPTICRCGAPSARHRVPTSVLQALGERHEALAAEHDNGLVALVSCRLGTRCRRMRWRGTARRNPDAGWFTLAMAAGSPLVGVESIAYSIEGIEIHGARIIGYRIYGTGGDGGGHIGRHRSRQPTRQSDGDQLSWCLNMAWLNAFGQLSDRCKWRRDRNTCRTLVVYPSAPGDKAARRQASQLVS